MIRPWLLILSTSLSVQDLHLDWGAKALYVASFVVMYLLLASTGLDLMTAFSAVAASINNLGPGLAGVGSNYASLNDPAKWILCFGMSAD